MRDMNELEAALERGEKITDAELEELELCLADAHCGQMETEAEFHGSRVTTGGNRSLTVGGPSLAWSAWSPPTASRRLPRSPRCPRPRSSTTTGPSRRTR